MERKHTTFFFLTAIPLVWFGIVLLMLANGGILQPSAERPEFLDFHASVPMYLIPYGLICLGLFTIIMRFVDDPEPLYLLAGYGLIIGGLPLSYLIGFPGLLACLFAVYGAICFGGMTVSSLIHAWDDYNVGTALLITLLHAVVTAALVLFVVVWANIPSTYASAPAISEALVPVYQTAGYLSIAAGVALAGEGVIWYCTLDY